MKTKTKDGHKGTMSEYIKSIGGLSIRDKERSNKYMMATPLGDELAYQYIRGRRIHIKEVCEKLEELFEFYYTAPWDKGTTYVLSEEQFATVTSMVKDILTSIEGFDRNLGTAAEELVEAFRNTTKKDLRTIHSKVIKKNKRDEPLKDIIEDIDRIRVDASKRNALQVAADMGKIKRIVRDIEDAINIESESGDIEDFDKNDAVEHIDYAIRMMLDNFPCHRVGFRNYSHPVSMRRDEPQHYYSLHPGNKAFNGAGLYGTSYKNTCYDVTTAIRNVRNELHDMQLAKELRGVLTEVILHNQDVFFYNLRSDKYRWFLSRIFYHNIIYIVKIIIAGMVPTRTALKEMNEIGLENMEIHEIIKILIKYKDDKRGPRVYFHSAPLEGE